MKKKKLFKVAQEMRILSVTEGLKCYYTPKVDILQINIYPINAVPLLLPRICMKSIRKQK